MSKLRRRYSTPKPSLDTQEVSPQEQLRPDQYLSRELTWLDFNDRVLHQAADERTPLLERVFFLGIFTSNLDEFIMKRVGLLRRQVEADIIARRLDGMTPTQELAAIRKKLLPMIARQAAIYTEKILPALAKEGIHVLAYKDLAEEERKEAEHYFRTKVFPVLTPLAVDPGHPFPFISNLSTSLGVTLRYPDQEEQLFARVKVPEVLPCYHHLESNDGKGGYRFISLLDLIHHNLGSLFPGMTVLNVMPFRITRNADVEFNADEGDNLLELVAQELRQRRFEKAVRLEHGANPDPWMRQFLMQEMDLTEEAVFETPALLDYTTLRGIAELPRPELRYEPWAPLTPKALADESADIFSVIRRSDVLLHHPYESFHASIERFVRNAAEDPNVLAIKITLYRTGDDSPFIPALIQAAESGKQVVAIVELMARFDEARNIFLAQSLEKAGVHVVYGILELKTHSKTTLVVRKEQDGLRCYAHIGTGNYHVQTARLYTDISLLTCRTDLTEDLVDMYHYLTGRSLKREYRKLLVAPVNMAQRFRALIEKEVANRAAGKPARIVAKMNSLEDHAICKALYRASQAGVPIDLIVRGFCCLRPGVPGLSENIRVSSVIGRFLEHSRVFYFASGSEDPLQGQFYIGSADWMYRNLQARVEVVTPVEDASAKARLWEILQIMLADCRQAWEMKPDGTYALRMPPPGATGPAATGTHRALMELTRRMNAATG